MFLPDGYKQSEKKLTAPLDRRPSARCRLGLWRTGRVWSRRTLGYLGSAIGKEDPLCEDEMRAASLRKSKDLQPAYLVPQLFEHEGDGAAVKVP